MMKHSNKFAAVLLSTVIGFSALTTTSVVEAAEKKRKTYTLSERVGKKVGTIYDLYSSDQIDEAIKLALELKPKKPYDKAYINKFLGSMYAGKQGKGKEAIKYLKASVEADILSTNEHASAIRTVADLQLQEKEFNGAIKYYKMWMEFTGKQDPAIWVRIGNAYTQLKQYAKTIGPADKAIALYKEPNKNPYLLKLGAYYELKQPAKAIGVLETLVETFPEEPKFWGQLGQFYMLNEQYEKALATMHIAYINGYLTKGSQIRVLAQLYANNNIPHRAAKVLEKHIKSGEIDRDEKMLKVVAGSWHQAKDIKKAIKYYGEAAAIAQNGELYYKQGLLAFELEDHKGAIKALKLALKDESLRQPDNALFTMAQAHFYNKQYKSAYAKMVQASQGKSKSVAKNAKIWINYIKDTAKRKKVAYR
ncbi:lipopolysaccharide assembly protein LapB [Psychrobium sp. 1_MG-2023]|uniref:tetratricopeptide repeat protein n=1 Tax=Psychrobium sp. 1_MG-2023 TaxID=3062624 RepID=UPI000C349EAA|nr:tetratricopeptide repeat protein [Psychrobium sp. 1_MG-2023]MDP2559939.1 tetratricopeptide repeat protein [Psychrobium sp. 1_MG-2023]PKF56392.1 hypothetical protein CW748_10595 [Alteromonadales bacterium alter-6D02]